VALVHADEEPALRLARLLDDLVEDPLPANGTVVTFLKALATAVMSAQPASSKFILKITAISPIINFPVSSAPDPLVPVIKTVPRITKAVTN
jgi:hypothetical protein